MFLNVVLNDGFHNFAGGDETNRIVVVLFFMRVGGYSTTKKHYSNTVLTEKSSVYTACFWEQREN